MPSFLRLTTYPSHTRQIKIDSLFTNYRIQSNAANEITIALSTEALLGALKSASASAASASYDMEEIVVKLAKKTDQAVLSFEINALTRVGMTVRVAHDVRIDVLRPSDVAKLSEPLCPEPDVSVKAVCSRIQALILVSRFYLGAYRSAAIAKTQNRRRPPPTFVRHACHPGEQ
jgi:hypothetical protein